jgi:hypothetical protein
VRPVIRLQWVTENELDVTGYNVFRGEDEAGPFQRVNEALLPPADDPVVGGDHLFVDEGVRLWRTYFYQLETIDRSGNRARSGTIRLRPRLGFAWP